MKVCFVNLPAEFYTVSRPGAIAIVIQGITKQLEARGIEVVVISRDSDAPALDGGRVISWHYPTRNDVSLAKRLWYRAKGRLRMSDVGFYRSYAETVAELLRAEAPDVAIAHNDPQAARWLPRSGVGMSGIWFHNKMTTYVGRGFDLSGVDLVVAPSQFLSGWISRNFRLSEAGVVAVPNGVDPLNFHSGRRPGREVALRVLFVGRLEPNKGPDLVVDAVSDLAEEGVPIELTVAGAVCWWDEDRRLTPYAHRVVLEAQRIGAKWVGVVSRGDMPAMYRSHDVVCVPSRDEEGFGLVAAEAMACGCAIVSSAKGGLAETCGDAALVIDTEGHDGLREALRRLSEDEEYLGAMMKRATSRGAELTWERGADRFVSAIKGGWSAEPEKVRHVKDGGPDA